MSERIREIDVVMRAGMLLAADNLEERRVHVTVRVCNSERRRRRGQASRGATGCPPHDCNLYRYVPPPGIGCGL